MLRSAIEKGKCMSSLRITYSKWHRVNELKAKTEEIWLRILGAFAKEEKREKTDCIFPRGPYPEGGKHLRTAKRTDRAESKERWAEPSQFAQGVPKPDEYKGVCLHIILCPVMMWYLWVQCRYWSRSISHCEWILATAALYPTMVLMKSQAKMTREPTIPTHWPFTLGNK